MARRRRGSGLRSRECGERKRRKQGGERASGEYAPGGERVPSHGDKAMSTRPLVAELSAVLAALAVRADLARRAREPAAAAVRPI
jgi:hypothetical protein